MFDPDDLFVRTRIAQRQAEHAGFTGTAAALAEIAERLHGEAGAAMIARIVARREAQMGAAPGGASGTDQRALRARVPA